MISEPNVRNPSSIGVVTSRGSKSVSTPYVRSSKSIAPNGISNVSVVGRSVRSIEVARYDPANVEFTMSPSTMKGSWNAGNKGYIGPAFC